MTTEKRSIYRRITGDDIKDWTKVKEFQYLFIIFIGTIFLLDWNCIAHLIFVSSAPIIFFSLFEKVFISFSLTCSSAVLQFLKIIVKQDFSQRTVQNEPFASRNPPLLRNSRPIKTIQFKPTYYSPMETCTNHETIQSIPSRSKSLQQLAYDFSFLKGVLTQTCEISNFLLGFPEVSQE